MVTCNQNHCTFETRCDDADAMLLCGDCMGCFLLNRQENNRWIVSLDLPPGMHHFRYYGRFGTTMIWQGEDAILVQPTELHTDPLQKQAS